MKGKWIYCVEIMLARCLPRNVARFVKRAPRLHSAKRKRAKRPSSIKRDGSRGIVSHRTGTRKHDVPRRWLQKCVFGDKRRDGTNVVPFFSSRVSPPYHFSKEEIIRVGDRRYLCEERGKRVMRRKETMLSFS